MRLALPSWVSFWKTPRLHEVPVGKGDMIDIFCRVRKANGDVISGIWLALPYEDLDKLSQLVGARGLSPHISKRTEE